ncbi:hypothetical protein Hypma_007359 [Hypsizygus marmoreus]|uniref:Uncharacterized protein n=1 Tax=Hypsizygus marmoreus TaxID=39966 RepID=A0A369JXC2_HYPMA|nr:hypothetical protein Hypma_007359 [Hypsizygus marmoreus]
MNFSLSSNYSSPVDSPSAPPAHRRSSSTSSTSSSSSTWSNSALSLRERRGVSLRLSISLSEADKPNMSAKGHLEPRFSNLPRRRRALPTPTIEGHAVVASADGKSGMARDFGMGDDGWTAM